MINVVIVDDYDLIRAGMKYALSQTKGIKVIGETSTGEEAIRLVNELNPEVIIMDVKLSGISGLDTTRKILQSHPDMKVLIVTSCNDTIYPIRLLEAGISGYLTKSSSLSSFVQAVRSVHAGQRYICSEVAQRMVFEKMGSPEGTLFDNLSNRELQIALLIARGKRTAYVASKLSLSPKTINSYRYRIFKKLKVNGDVELTKLVIRHKLVDL
jgi:two-component system, NarL family, invasion response regulator UvrY